MVVWFGALQAKQYFEAAYFVELFLITTMISLQRRADPGEPYAIVWSAVGIVLALALRRRSICSPTSATFASGAYSTIPSVGYGDSFHPTSPTSQCITSSSLSIIQVLVGWGVHAFNLFLILLENQSGDQRRANFI